MQTIDGGFIAFLREEATSLCVATDGAPIRIFNDGQASSVEVYVRSLEARDSIGKSAVTYPVLSIPHAIKASGVLTTIPIRKLYIEDLLPNGCFRFLILKCDVSNTNRAAVKMLMSELQSGKELLAVNQICVARSLNNSGFRGLGNFPYGAISRTSHVYEAIRFNGS